MIIKISTSDYLKRYDNMNAGEQQLFETNVNEWLRNVRAKLLARSEEQAAELQNVIQVSFGWNDDDCAAFQDGARLLSAFAGQSDTWLPDMLYTKTARRSIKRMITLLTNGIRKDTPIRPLSATTEHVPEHSSSKTLNSPFGQKQRSLQKELISTNSNATPVRPKHIDQYIHLLPAKTQEKAAQVRGLLQDLDAARENARLLMDAGECGDKIAQWAKTATTLDAKIKSIYKELDDEWEKLVQSGRVGLDAFGNAYVKPAKTIPEGEGGGTPDNKATEHTTLAADKADDNQRKAALLRKWLIDTRNAKSKKQTEKWTAKYREMVSLGGIEAITDKVREAAKHYEIDINNIQM